MQKDEKLKILFHITKKRFKLLFSPEAEKELRDLADVIGPYEEDSTLPPANDLKNASIAFISHLTDLDERALEMAPHLRWIHEGTGHPPKIDYKEAFKRDITVTHTGNVFGVPVAEMALGLFLASYRRIIDHDKALHTESGKEGDHYLNTREAYGKTAGIIGLGTIGSTLARLLDALGMRVIAYDPYVKTATQQGVEMVGLEELLASSDGIFLTAAPSPGTRQLLDGSRLDLIRNDAVLVNVSRALLIDYEALVERLTAGRFRAALDVFPIEPLPEGDPLRSLDNVILIPHRAGGSVEARLRMGSDFVHDLRNYLAGNSPSRSFLVTPVIAVQRGYLEPEED
jgi:phosphoglycerate dehydrogenase-like enzyme